MQKVAVCLSVCLLALGLSACGSSSSPTAPTVSTPPPPVIPACQSTHTASVSFGNTSRTTTQDIFWDGLKTATLAPGQTSNTMTVAAGATHQLTVRVTNTSLLACTASAPVPAECSFPVYTCAFP